MTDYDPANLLAAEHLTPEGRARLQAHRNRNAALPAELKRKLTDELLALAAERADLLLKDGRETGDPSLQEMIAVRDEITAQLARWIDKPTSEQYNYVAALAEQWRARIVIVEANERTAWGKAEGARADQQAAEAERLKSANKAQRKKGGQTKKAMSDDERNEDVDLILRLLPDLYKRFPSPTDKQLINGLRKDINEGRAEDDVISDSTIRRRLKLAQKELFPSA